jgi:hypothetical protein
MSLGTKALRDALVSHAQASALFERVNGHDSMNAPGNGLSCSVSLATIDPVQSSGLSASSARVAFMVRVLGALTEPQDDIDPTIGDATDALMGAYSGDFELGSNARCIDLLGQAGTPLSAKAGYLQIGDKELRLMDITVPIIVNDAWEQTP